MTPSQEGGIVTSENRETILGKLNQSRFRKSDRLGNPKGPLSHEEHKKTIEYLLGRLTEDNWTKEFDLPMPFKQHFNAFRKKLENWETIPIRKCMRAFDILIGCLSIGPSFATWLKKARYFSYVAAVAEVMSDVEEEYVLPGYEGYDSLFRESDLIHWLEDTQDVEYSFIPTKEVDLTDFRRGAKSFLKQYLPKVDLKDRISTLEWMKASRVYDPERNKGIPLRDGLRGLTEIREGYYGKRTVIQAFPAGVRDTAMADPETIGKIRLAHQVFSKLCDVAENSAMSKSIDRNVSRVLRRKMFYHLDFKKIGLTLPRQFITVLGEELEELGVNAWFIRDVKDIYLETEDDVYKTTRGFCLGWFNEGLTIIIIILLRLFAETYNLDMDFVVFNDDVLIGLQDSDPENFFQLFKIALQEFFSRHDIFLSDRKLYASKAAQFLEEYYHTDRLDKPVNMEKRQIGSCLFAQSMLTPFVWEAKMFAEVAYDYYENDTLLEMCFEVGYEYSKRELEMPYASGGWITPRRQGLNTSLENEWCLRNLLELRKVQVSEIAEKEKPYSAEKSYRKKNLRIAFARQIREKTDEIRDFLEEQENAKNYALVYTRAEQYRGNKKIFPRQLLANLEKVGWKTWDPGGTPPGPQTSSGFRTTGGNLS